MQKKLIALAVASLVSAPVFAQSTVSVYGVVDQAITNQSQSNRGSVTSLQGSGYTTERLGFKGSEDMGNGMKANFMLELGMKGPNGNLDNAQAAPAQLFQRVSTVGLSGNWGSVNFGRQYTPVFSVQAANDLFRVAGVGSIYSLTNVGVTRSSNSIRYDSASMSGFSVAVLYGLGDTGLGNVSTDTPLTAPLVGNNPSNLGRQVGFNAMYNNGPLMIGLGWNRLNLPAITAAPLNTFDSQKTTSLTASYDFKVVAINAGWQNNKITDNLQDRNTWNIGATIPVFGADSVKVSYADRHDKLVNSADVKLLALGYVHPMSKRTTLYGTYAKLKNDNNSAQGFIFGAPGTNVLGGYGPNAFQLGMSHNF